MLEIRQLEKHYKNFTVGPLDMSIEAGSATALIGANGAGKTTLFRSIMGLISRDGGIVSIGGEECDPAKGLWRQQLGYLGDYLPFYDRWSGAQNLKALSKFYPGWSASYAAELVQRLQLNISQKVGSYSTGQRTKLAIIVALAHRPKLLLLDEPANGLDPVSRDEFLTILFEHMEAGDTALLYATHHITELEGLADRLIFFNGGHIYSDEVKEDLLERWRLLSFSVDQEIRNAPSAQLVRSELPVQKLISSDHQSTLQFLENEGVLDIAVSRMSTEEIAVQVLKKMLREESNV